MQWGSGTSTMLVAPLARRAWSIEEYHRCEKLKAANPPLLFWEDNKVLRYICIDFGELLA